MDPLENLNLKCLGDFRTTSPSESLLAEANAPTTSQGYGIE